MSEDSIPAAGLPPEEEDTGKQQPWYSLDLGFDRLALVDPRNGHRPRLQYGLTVPDVEGNPVALSRRLTCKDQPPYLITVYDITQNPEAKILGIQPVVTGMALRLFVSPARPRQGKTPFLDPPTGGEQSLDEAGRPSGDGGATVSYLHHWIYPVPSSQGLSTVFDQTCASWTVQPPGRELPASWPPSGRGQLQEGSNKPKARFRLADRGRFYLTCELWVQWAEGPPGGKCYQVDPEMLVDSDGTIDPPGPG